MTLVVGRTVLCHAALLLLMLLMAVLVLVMMGAAVVAGIDKHFACAKCWRL